MPGFYSSKVNASVVGAAPVAAPLGIGEVVSALGRTAGAISDQNQQASEHVAKVDAAIAEREQARKQDAASASVAVKLAQGEGEYSRWVIDHQNDADFEAQANAKVEADMAALRGELGNDPELLNHYNPLLVRSAEARKTAAYEHVAAVRAKASAEASDQALTVSMNNAETAPDRTSEFADTMTTSIMANKSIPEALRPLVAHTAAGQVWQKGLAASIRSGRYEAVAKELNAGTYDAILPEGAKDGLLRLADAEGNAAATAARADAAVQTKLLNDKIQSVEAIIGAGGDPGPDVLDALHKQALAQGDGSAATKLQIWTLQTSTNRQWAGRSMLEKVAGMQSLEADNAAGKLDAKGQIGLAQLRKLISTETVNIGAKLKPEYETSPQGRQAVAKQLDALPMDQRWQTAEQIDKGFGAYVLAPANVRDVAIAGRSDRDWVKDQFKHGKLGHDPVREFRQFMGAAARDRDGSEANGILDVATSLYAYYAKRDGLTEFNQTRFQMAINMTLGGTLVNGEWHGGLGEYGGNKVQLPSGVSQRTFAATIEKLDYPGAKTASGAALTKAQVLKHYRIAYQGDSEDGSRAVYHFVDPQGLPVLRADGSPYPIYFGNH